MAKDKPMVYGVIIYRTDGQHLIVMEDPDYDKCFERWQQVQGQWQDVTKEQQPFVLTDPIVTAFAPSMIYEVKLVPMNTQENVSKSHNPYYSAMNEQGFTRTFPGRDLLG